VAIKLGRKRKRLTVGILNRSESTRERGRRKKKRGRKDMDGSLDERSLKIRRGPE